MFSPGSEIIPLLRRRIIVLAVIHKNQSISVFRRKPSFIPVFHEYRVIRIDCADSLDNLLGKSIRKLRAVTFLLVCLLSVLVPLDIDSETLDARVMFIMSHYLRSQCYKIRIAGLDLKPDGIPRFIHFSQVLVVEILL